MIVYLNYPRAKISIHRSEDCPHIQKQGKIDQRYFKLDLDNCVETLQVIERTPFTSTAESNDLWLEISFGNPDQEFSIVIIVQAILGKRYSPFREAVIEKHDCD